MKSPRSVTRRAATIGIAAVSTAALSRAAAAQTRSLRRGAASVNMEHMNPRGLSTPRGYSHVVSASSGRTIYISGQVSADGAGAIVGKGDLKAQTTQVFANLKVALAAAGVGPSEVVKSNIYVVNMKPEDVPVVREARNAFYEGVEPPASTLVGVSALAHPDYLIEIEVIAVAPQVAAVVLVR